MAGTKHIRTSYKNAGPLRLGAGRLCGLLAAASAVGGRAAVCLSGCRRCKEGRPPPGVVVLSVEARAAG